VVVEELLQFLIGEVDAKLLKTVELDRSKEVWGKAMSRGTRNWK